ncbi:MAG: ABC transporter substrate-binding protein [Actinomycetota bacterium]
MASLAMTACNSKSKTKDTASSTSSAAATSAASSAAASSPAATGGASSSPAAESSSPAPGGTATAEFNAADGKVFKETSDKGGTLRYANSGDWDSLDPADTYYGYSWNFIRNYGRQLVVFKAAPGAAGAELVPDLAETLGKPSADAKTWTYKLRAGVKFEDGTPITSKDVKYGVERALDKEAFPNGPTYFNDFLDLQGYKGPYKDKGKDNKSIETPDDQTIVFHLKTAFAGMDYFAQLPSTIPVPAAKDTGAKYKEHVISSGPYKFSTNNLGKNFELVRNENYDPATDPDSGRKPLADKITVALNVNSDDIDNRLQSGDLDIAVEGTGVGPAAQGKIIGDPKLKANADSAAIARLWYTGLNKDVAPLDNEHCRKAILIGVDHTGYQRAYGGAIGGDIATNMLPPQIPGAKVIDLYEAGTKPEGDPDKAKEELKACGKDGGFSTNISYRAERPKEKATAEALQQSLSKIGIKLTLKPFPAADYYKLYAGKPDYAKTNGLGMIVAGWAADWPDGFGFLQQISDSRVIRATGGNTNIGIRLPAVDALFDKALAETDKTKREAIWADIDKTIMESSLALPGLWAKGLLYRNENLTNAFVNVGFGMYDYAAIGTSKK